MNLQGRSLTVKLQGADVALLQTELRSLGYVIAQSELDASTFGPTTQAAVRDFQARHRIDNTGVVDQVTATAINSAVGGLSKSAVRGFVRAYGTTAKPAAVVVIDKELRHERELGRQTLTDSVDGSYSVTYTRGQLARPSKQRADLVVRALDAQDKILAQSSIVFRAGNDETINLLVGAAAYRDVSEWTLVDGALSAALDHVQPIDLSDDDLTFLSGDSGLGLARVQLYRNAFRLAKTTGVNDAPLFYALGRLGVATTADHLAHLKPAALTRAANQAIVENIVDPEAPAVLARTIEAISAWAINWHFQPAPVTGGQIPIGTLVATGLANVATQRQFVEEWLKFQGSAPAFWQHLKSIKVALSEIAQLQLSLQFGALSFNYPPLVERLQALKSGGQLSSLADLTRYAVSDWVNLLNGVGAPEVVRGTNPQEKVANYARLLHRMIEDAFPTQAVTHRNANNDVGRFLANNPNFDFHSTPVTAYLAANPNALSGLTDPAGATNTLKRTQRLLRVTSQLDHVEALAAHGYDSAQAIARTSKSELLRLGDALNGAATETIQVNALNAFALGQIISSKYGGSYQMPIWHAIPWFNPATLPNWNTLFSPMSLCACVECRSTLGPAAYLVDLLQFIDQTSRNELFRRRPEIRTLYLDCPNTNTPLPYIDLVNEILEASIAGTSAAHQTKAPADELAANPQYLVRSVYDTTLVQAVYPWTLPFSFADEQARIYLRHLGVELSDVMDIFRSATAPTDQVIAAKYLGLQPGELNAPTSSDGRAAWGLTANGWETTLLNVGTLLTRSRLTPDELQQLIATEYLNPAGQIALSSTDGRCDPATTTLTGVSSTQFFEHMHRFVRLWRHLGWTVFEVDRAIAALRPPLPAIGDINADLVVQLVAIDRLYKQLHVPVLELLAWWTPVDLRADTDGRSFYDRVFSNPAVLDPPDPALAIVPPATEPPAGKFGMHAAAIQAATGLHAADLALLSGPMDAITRGSLSAVFAVASFCRATALGVTDFLTATALLGPALGSPTVTRMFLDKLARLGESGLALADVKALLVSTAGPTLDNAAVESTIGEFVRGLAAIDAAGFIDNADPIAAVTQKLGVLLAPADVAIAIGIIDRTVLASDANALITRLDDPLKSALAALLADAATPVANRYRTFAPTVSAAARDFQRTTYIIRRIAALFGVGTDVAATIAAAPFVAPPSTGALGSGKTPLALLLDASLSRPASDPDGATQRANLRLLDKIGFLASRLSLGKNELLWIETTGRTNLGWLDLNQLPVTTGATPIAYGRLEPIFDFVSLRAKQPTSAPSLLTIIDAALNPASPPSGLNAVLVQIALATGWDDPTKLTQLAALVDAANGLGFDTTALRTSFDPLRRLAACFAVMHRTGLPADVLLLVSQALDFETSNALKLAARSKYDRTTWLKVAKPLRDPLREMQRDALVDYLVGRGVGSQPMRDEKDLFDYFLIDVQMSSCQLTSRIKQAISAVQLFIQRALMNLEPAATTLDTDHQRNWVWMRSFRLWQANREVFHYPENWIDETLLDVASPIYGELRDELAQNDLTADRAETALKHYVEKFDHVARLDIIAIYYEAGSQQPPICHVIGRTAGEPRDYYYRRRIGWFQWTAWEQVNIDMTGDLVAPVVWDGRLFLFWLITQQKANDVQSTPPTPNPLDPVSQPQTHLEFKLAWTERQEGKWTAKRTSTGVVEADWQISFSAHWYSSDSIVEDTKGPNLSDFVIEALPLGDSLHVKVIWSRPHGDAPHRVYIFSRPNIWTPVDDIGYPSAAMIAEFIFQPCALDPTINSFAPSDVELIEPTFAPPLDNEFFADHIAGLELATGAPPYDFVTISPDPSRELVLDNAPSPYTIVFPHQEGQFLAPPSFYQDQHRTFFVDVPPPYRPRWHVPDQITPNILGVLTQLYTGSAATEFPPQVARYDYRFFISYEPFACDFLQAVYQGGSALLYQWQNDTSLQYSIDSSTTFADEYQPQPLVDPDYPTYDVDFVGCGTYVLYNWELFFHVPFLIATQLSQNQKHQDAQKWFHYIFDPTDRSNDPTPMRFWRFKPFRDLAQTKPTDDLTTLFTAHPLSDTVEQCGLATFMEQVQNWIQNPFNPHTVARLRISAYQKAVVYQYIQNLISWGDKLFRNDTLEDINQAAQLYVLAWELLGRKPQGIVKADDTELSYADLTAPGHLLDAFSNELETYMPAVSPATPGIPPVASPPATPGVAQLVFCVPPNPQLLAVWDIIADRLNKIRRCQNIEGVFRQLPLWDAPLDVAALIAGLAAGEDLSSAIGPLQSPLPHYRFTYMIAKANELCGELRQLGASFLAALEKRDAEDLALLRADHELGLLRAVRHVKERQVAEAQSTRESLSNYLSAVESRFQYYSTRKFVSVLEGESLAMTSSGALLGLVAQGLSTGASVAYYFPQFITGVAGIGATPVALVGEGGLNIGSASSSAGTALSIASAQLSLLGSITGTMAAYERRMDEWQMQAQVAASEVEQVKQQIVAAQARADATQHDLDAHDLQIEQSSRVETFMRTKYTNRDLYDWMVRQLSTTYFRSYQLAYDLAKRAERAFQYERGLFDPATKPFIQPVAWDNLKQGLLAGERLQADLRAMEAAYLDQNAREFEITKHISLQLVSPEAFEQLKQSGACEFDLEEVLYDLDFPGHYMRRLKSVALTVPCVVGPYTNVSLQLTLLKSWLRYSNANTAVGTATSYGNPMTDSDPARFAQALGAVGSIATSNAQNDSGLFELNFRDERYLPFEGVGAVGRWRLEFPSNVEQFDRNSITDLILHVRYTARDGGSDLRSDAGTSVINRLSGSDGTYQKLLFSTRSDFEDGWEQFLNPPTPTAPYSFNFTLKPDLLPFPMQDRAVTVSQLILFPVWKSPSNPTPLAFSVARTDGVALVQLSGTSLMSRLPYPASIFDATTLGVIPPGGIPLTITVASADLNAGYGSSPTPTKRDMIADIGIALAYRAPAAP